MTPPPPPKKSKDFTEISLVSLSQRARSAHPWFDCIFLDFFDTWLHKKCTVTPLSDDSFRLMIIPTINACSKQSQLILIITFLAHLQSHFFHTVDITFCKYSCFDLLPDKLRYHFRIIKLLWIMKFIGPVCHRRRNLGLKNMNRLCWKDKKMYRASPMFGHHTWACLTQKHQISG